MSRADDLVSGTRVVPVVVIEEVDVAVPLAETLLASGLETVEITLRTPAALDAIAAIAHQVPDLIVGAGSLRTASQVTDVLEAGAQFGVSPGHSDALLSAVEAANLPFIPGAITPSESLALLDRGYTLQKLFPAGVAGGIPYLKAVSGPLPEVGFMPTGGISVDNARDYLALPNVTCVGGSWMVPAALLRDRDFKAIATLAKAAAAL
jgi:2-dehydro-3-deoxyphosphogluconate aldolase/(4S)-4-hydroxy-2-oxoglutarate aldolase